MPEPDNRPSLILDHIYSCELDLDLDPLIYKLDPYLLEIYWM